jgi:hypothetical protein
MNDGTEASFASAGELPALVAAAANAAAPAPWMNRRREKPLLSAVIIIPRRHAFGPDEQYAGA